MDVTPIDSSTLKPQTKGRNLPADQSIVDARKKFQSDLIKKKKEERRAAARERIRKKNDLAAKRIQSVVRGSQSRKKVNELRKKSLYEEEKDNDEQIVGVLIVQVLSGTNIPVCDAQGNYVSVEVCEVIGKTDIGTISQCNPDDHEYNMEMIFDITPSIIFAKDHLKIVLHHENGSIIGRTNVLIRNALQKGSFKVNLNNNMDDSKPISLLLYVYFEDDHELEKEVLTKEAQELNVNMAAVLKIQSNYRGFKGRLVAKQIRQSRNAQLRGEAYNEACREDRSAAKIQALARGNITRKYEIPKHKDFNCVWPDVLNLEPEGGWPFVTRGSGATDDIIKAGHIRVYVTTWNLQAHKPPSNLADLIKPNRFHIYAIGTEECVNSIAKSVIFHSKKEWEQTIRDILGDQYVMLCSHSLQAIHNIVFVHWSLIPLIDDVQSSAVPTGLGNKMGNKGGVGISFRILSTSFLFISSHFEAHQSRFSKRNANFHKINTELNIYPSKRDKTTDASVGYCASNIFDRVFWSGDLNYRINGTRKMIDSVLSKNIHSVLLFNDQLRREMQQGNVLEGFEEGPLNFRPTYKFDKGCDTYDSSPKQRIPSWTDRILYRSNNSLSDIKIQAYSSCSSIKSSDHRPVYAVFEVKFKECDGNYSSNPVTNQVKSEVCSVQ